MKKYLAALLLYLTSSFLLSSCNQSVLNSLTTIRSGKQFELGGNRHGAFTAQLQNVGDVPVTISEQFADGKRITRGMFQPGARQTVQFAPGSAVLFDNLSTKPAQLRLVVTGDKNLSMRELSN